MQKWLLLCYGMLMAASAYSQATGTPAGVSSGESEAFTRFARKIDVALGRFNDITVFKQDSAKGTWRLVSGRYVPVTVEHKVPTRYSKDMPSDRPMMLPTRVQGFAGGDGQSAPFSVVGRMPGSNPEVQWVFVVRQYSIKNTTDADFPNSGDMAVIGHHPRTGATAFLQFYDPANPKSGRVVVSPFSAKGADFWSPVHTLAENFQCQRCHNAGPFIHTPWINQVTVRKAGRKAPPPEPMVPSDPFGPYFFIDAGDGELFAPWDNALVAAKGGGHLNKPQNKCTQCHRVAPSMIGLNQNATRYAGLSPTDSRNEWSVRSDTFQTPAYRKLPWMPTLATPPVDFYAGQEAFAPNWDSTYGESASEVNKLEADEKAWKKAHTDGIVADVPRPPKQYQAIVVNRPNQDPVGPKQSVWIVDSRMRANTDGDLQQWRFYAKGPTNDGMQAAPVVYRRKPNSGSSNEFEVVFVGEARGYASAGDWVSVRAKQTFRVRQGDYFGIVFAHAGSGSDPAIIPYTEDDWAKLKMPDGSTWLRDGSVTYQLTTIGAPGVGKRLVFKDADFRTYSYEFKNRL